MDDLRGKRPKVLGARVAGLRLTPEERYVMARIDGQLSVDELVGLTGIEPERLTQIVSKLAFEGALDLGEPAPRPPVPGEIDDGGLTSLDDFAAALGLVPARPTPPAPELEEVFAAPRAEHAPQQLATEPVLEREELVDEESDERTEEGGAPAEDGADPAERAIAERNYRQVFEARWHPLSVDQRMAGAHTSHGADLFALCFDPDPRVVAALLENATLGLDHVRLIAFHHRTGTGLEMLSRRQDWLRDALVERRLLRNPMVGELVLNRVMGPKRLFPTYKIAIDRDVPELSRIKCRGYIRQKWQNAPPEDRADFLLRTEARCLTLMTGCTFDAKTTAILCGRPVNSAMFVQSVAKFSGSPPGLLAHLVKQPFVRKNVALKKMLMRHPNLPGDVKRNL